MGLIERARVGLEKVKSKVWFYPAYKVLARAWRALRRNVVMEGIRGFQNPGNPSEATKALGLTPALTAQLFRIANQAKAIAPEEFSELVEFARNPEFDRQYREFGMKVPKILEEETAWLADLIRQAWMRRRAKRCGQYCS